MSIFALVMLFVSLFGLLLSLQKFFDDVGLFPFGWLSAAIAWALFAYSIGA